MTLFERVPHSSVFLFQYGTYTTCSTTEYDQFKNALSITYTPRTEVEECTQGSHYALEPFFRTTCTQLRLLYEAVAGGEKIVSDSDKEFIKKQAEALQCFDPRSPDPNKCFVTGGDINTCGTTFEDDTWTQRLCGCLKLVVAVYT